MDRVGRVMVAALAMVVALGPTAEVRAGQSVPRPEEVAVRSLLARQVARFPAMESQDVYKLLYQATMGSRHAGLDSAMAARWLERELRDMGPGPGEPVVDTISADGRMARQMARDGEIELSTSALHRYFTRMRAAGYPAVEHSAGYLAAYRPAYRVVLGALLP